MCLYKNTSCYIDFSLRKHLFLLGVASVLLAVDFLVVEEDTVGLSGTQEVIISRTGTRTTPNSRTNLLATITALQRDREAKREKERGTGEGGQMMN